jgi:hypothetical protein
MFNFSKENIMCRHGRNNQVVGISESVSFKAFPWPPSEKLLKMVEEKGYPIKYKIVNGKSIPP